jgi:hypothetical protein
MKKQKEIVHNAAKKTYVTPDLVRIAIDHEISLVMMSESTEPPPENIGIVFNPLKFLR